MRKRGRLQKHRCELKQQLRNRGYSGKLIEQQLKSGRDGQKRSFRKKTKEGKVR